MTVIKNKNEHIRRMKAHLKKKIKIECHKVKYMPLIESNYKAFQSKHKAFHPTLDAFKKLYIVIFLKKTLKFSSLNFHVTAIKVQLNTKYNNATRS